MDEQPKHPARAWACTVHILDTKHWHEYACNVEAGQPHVAVNKATARCVRSFRSEHGRKKITQVKVTITALIPLPVRPSL